MTGVWLPFKELASVVTSAVLHKQSDFYYTLEAVLKKHKPDFISLLQNPAKNATHRSQVQKAVKEGIKTPSLPSLHPLSQDFVDETLVLSDILDLNELSAVELLLAGEQQQPRFPGLSRGVVAVLLYHDGRRSIVSSLRSLVQAREGVSWTLGLSSATVGLITSFTDQLFADGLVDKILNLLDKIDVEKEIDNLSKGRAVGGLKHRQQLVELIQEQRTCLADCLFYWACQNPLPKEATLKLLRYLKKVKLSDDGDSSSTVPSIFGPPPSSSSSSPPKPLDPVVLSLFHTLLACFNIGDVSSEGNLDDSLVDEHYPLIADATFVPTLHAEVLKDSDWVSPSLHAVVKFAWAVLLRECSSRASFSGMTELEDDEGLVDQAVAEDVFHFLRRSIVGSPQFHHEEYYVRRMHWLLTSFIVNMPLKVKELRNQGDEVAREVMVRVVEGGEGAGSQRRDFEELMRLVGDLYSTDHCDLNLSLEFWSPVEAPGGGGGGLRGIHHRAPQRQLSLFNFIRLCCDLLPAPLFSPLMHMLTGLCNSEKTAHHGFNFLKANSPSLGGGGASAAISLDHFFHSLKQYYLGLRQDGTTKPTPTGCAITPQELEGLQSMLRLIRTIASLDEAARVVMYENQTWLPVASLFGLIGCSIPRSLKADILITLAAFARSPEIAGSMWHTLENAQVLNTVPSLSSLPGVPSFSQPATQEGSIQVELEEMESQAEEYPLTRAFLTLLDTLTEVPIPPTLGAGHRTPGFHPYLEFVKDIVFLRFDSRAYRHPTEKWEVAGLSLAILHKLLTSHDISPGDFTDQSYELQGGGVVTVPKPPGHTLLIHMMNDSQLLRKLLSLLDEGSRQLSNATSPPPESLAHASLLALKMVETSLAQQEEFMGTLRQQSQRVMVTPLHQLLLGINPRTGKADNLVNVARYVALSDCSPELALVAVRVLYWVSKFPKAAKELFTAITSDKDASVEVLHGFVEHLEWEDTETQGISMSDSLATVAGVHRAVQLDILKLLSLGVDRPSPNIAHYLLGFRIRAGKHISDTTLQDPGVLGSPRTCLHSILSLVSYGPDPSNPIGCHYRNPKLAELCYKLLCQMCANRDLSTPTLRYLRNNHDFFFVQLTHLPLNLSVLPQDHDSWNSLRVTLLHQQAWLLKSIAIELRITSLNQQRSHAQRIVNILLSEPSNQITDPGQMTNGIASESQYRSDFDFFQEGRRKILVLLDLVDFSDKSLPHLELQYFDQSAMEQAIGSCDAQDEISGLQYTDVKVLRKLLMNELNALQGAAAAGQRQSVQEEILSILEMVVCRNQVREDVHVSCTLFEAWRQLVEVTLHSLGEEGVRREVKMTLLFELIQDLLLKVEHSESSVLATSVHSVVLILIAHLRQTVVNANIEQNDALLSALYSGPLHGIMRGLIENIMKAPAGMQRVRAYLYGALLYYLLLTKQEEGEDRRKDTSLWQPDNEQNSVATGNLSLLGSFGDPFMETICRDACSGHDVARMLSLSLLDAILALDWQGTWLRFMSAKGYLQTLCASIQWEDEALQKMLLPIPEPLRSLYIYESKMAFLTRVAHNPLGARELISLNCLVYLSECRFIDKRPDYHGNGHTLVTPSSLHTTAAGGFIPTVAARYKQLFFPLLKFLLALLTCPGPQQKEACSQVTTLIGAHSDVFVAVLKEQQAHVSMATLQELALVTAVIGHSNVGQDWSPAERTTPLVSGLMRIQRLMLTLLPHFWSKQSWRAMVQLALSVEDRETQDVLLSEEASLLVQQICANIVAYCRVAMTMGGTEFTSPYSRILLTPDLSDAVSTRDKEPFAPSLPSPQSPSLGLLIRHLKECTEGYSASLESYQQYGKKLETTGNLSSEEMRQLLPPTINSDAISPSQQQLLARRRLKKLISHKRQELQHNTYIIENLLYILWCHLQFYLVHCKPVDVEGNLGVAGAGRQPMRRMQDYSFPSHHADATFNLSTLGEGAKVSDLEQLKTDTVKCLTDSLFKKLLDVEEAQHQTKAEMRVGFVQALVRRVRRLLRLKAAAKPIL